MDKEQEVLSDVPLAINVQSLSFNEGQEYIDPNTITPEEKQALYRKIDRHLLPILAVLFTMSFVDRGNIGNALALGLVKDLHLNIGVRQALVTSMFYIAYAIFEVPSQIMLTFTRPSIWIPGCMFAWGIVMTLSCLVKDYRSLLIARFFLGLSEAGIVPGMMFYLSLWYPRTEIARRAAYMLSTAAVGLAWGGILAYGLSKMEGIGGLHGWAWIFCVEGILTCIFAAIGFFTMKDYPEQALFLSESERQRLQSILRQDRKGLARDFQWHYLRETLADWKAYILILIYLGVLTTTFDIALFLPTIIKDLGFGAANAQLLIVPPHVLGWPITIAVSMLSDRLKARGPFMMIFSGIAMIGFGVLRSDLATRRPDLGYVAIFFATIGTAVCIPISVTWITNNAGGDMKRATLLGLVLGTGSLGGIISAFTFRTQDAPRYALGHSVALGMLCVMFICSGVMSSVYHYLNQKKDRFCRENNINESTAEDYGTRNDRSPLFRYTV